MRTGAGSTFQRFSATELVIAGLCGTTEEQVAEALWGGGKISEVLQGTGGQMTATFFRIKDSENALQNGGCWLARYGQVRAIGFQNACLLPSDHNYLGYGRVTVGKHVFAWDCGR